MKELLLVICCPFLIHSQVQLNGRLIDEATKEILPFANIGIKNKNIGTVSGESGAFSITIPEKNIKDTLSFSLVGYDLKSIPVQQLLNSQKTVVALRAKAIQLKQVEVTAKKWKEVKYGIKKRAPLVHFLDGIANQADMFEVAQLVKLSDRSSKITSVNLLINESASDSGTFRINFYKYNGTQPAERLVDANILQTHPIREGWLKFDLKKYELFLKGEFVVAIEFFPRKKNAAPIKYEVKLGGAAKSFVKTVSMGTWMQLPHHYRIFLTALEVEPEKNIEKNEEEEKETMPDLRLYSNEVKDTFSLFIHLPKDYQRSKNKKYPVVYLLDANVYYDLVAASVKKYTLKNKSPEPILVGIGYKNVIVADSLRNRDYTFPKALPTDSFPVSGGAEKFLAFITTELDPALVKKLRLDTVNRTLMGHSLGGYFTLFALQKQLKNKTMFFKNYIAASPSLEYGDSYLFGSFKKIPSVNRDKINLLMTIGDRETEDAKAFEMFADLLSKNDFQNIKLNKWVIAGADHMETSLLSFDKGLELLTKE